MKEIETKAGTYKAVIEIQKKLGQGMSGIIRVLGEGSDERGEHLDELIKEGLLKACDTGGSMGHPESNVFYMPTKGYNVWEDDGTDGKYSRHKGRYLTYVRFYLGCMEKEADESRSDLYNAIHPSEQALVRNVEFMEDYAKWLVRNNESLKIMVSLEEDYYKATKTKAPTKLNPFSKEDIKWIKSRGWYKENNNVSKCLEESKKAESDGSAKKAISLRMELLSLYKTEPKKYADKIEEEEKALELDRYSLKIRSKLNEWLERQPKTSKIKTVVEKLK